MNLYQRRTQGSHPDQAFYGVPTSDEERFVLLDRVHELGCVYWDSAQLYGDSEELLGKWFQRTGKRKDVLHDLPRRGLRQSLIGAQIFLATKFGNKVTPDGRREINNDSDYIRSAVAESLKRLQTDYIDLLYWSVTHAARVEEPEPC